MPPKKKPVDRQRIVIPYTVLPAFAVRADAQRLGAVTGLGMTARAAINNLRAEIKRQYPPESYEVVEQATNLELWKATGWESPTYEEKRWQT
jgi:hypothetical protein